MKARFAIATTIVAVTFASLAIAKTTRMTGTFPGDPVGKIELSVVTNKHKKPKTLKDVVATYNYRCFNSDDVLTTQTTTTSPVPGSFKVTKSSNDGKYHFEGESQANGVFFAINGAVASNAKSAVGTLVVDGSSPEGGGCGNLYGNWEAAK